MTSWSVSRFEPSGCILGALLVVSGCTTFRAELKPAPVQVAATRPVPIRIGAHFPVELRKYEATYSWSDAFGGKEIYVFPVGDASVDLLHGAMRLLFNRVPVVEGVTDAGGADAVQNVLSFEIASVNIFVRRPFPWASFVEVAYRITAYDRRGREEVSWIVTGKAEKKDSSPFRSWPPLHLVEAVEAAMRDAADKFVSSFRELPEVRRWLEQLKHT